MLKRAFDFGFSAFALVAFLPLMLVISALIILTDGRPVLFLQKRCGLGGKEFDILKFRTMRQAAVNTMLLTAAGDARITPIGAALRRTKLDELPQMMNVLIGQMSIVGPRPEVPQFVESWTDDDRKLILSVRPGLTDPATLLFVDEEELLAASPNPSQTYLNEIVPRKLALYRSYVETISFSGDLRIIARTALLVLRRLGGIFRR